MNQTLIGDARDQLATLPDASVQCCVTSPPYFGLRSYVDADDPRKAHEIGAEPTVDAYVQNLVAVFREVRRVLLEAFAQHPVVVAEHRIDAAGIPEHRAVILERVG